MKCKKHGWVGESGLQCPEPQCPNGHRHSLFRVPAPSVTSVLDVVGDVRVSWIEYERRAYAYPPIGEPCTFVDPRTTVFHTWKRRG